MTTTDALFAGKVQRKVSKVLLDWLPLDHLGIGSCQRKHPSPAVDIVEKEKAYEITAELPGMDERNIDVKFSSSSCRRRGGAGSVKRWRASAAHEMTQGLDGRRADESGRERAGSLFFFGSGAASLSH